MRATYLRACPGCTRSSLVDVITNGSREVLARAQVLIRRDGAQERAFGRIAWAPVFVHPRRAREQLVVAHHVQQRHLHHRGVDHLRMLIEHYAHQQAAVRAAHHAHAARAGDAPLHEIAFDRVEIVIDHLPIGAQAGLVPSRAELAAAANVRHHINAAALEPEFADVWAVARRVRHLEAAIAVEQRRVLAVELHVARPDHEVRHARAVAANRLELLRHKARRVELRRQRTHGARARGVVLERIERVRRQIVFVHRERGVLGRR